MQYVGWGCTDFISLALSVMVSDNWLLEFSIENWFSEVIFKVLQLIIKLIKVDYMQHTCILFFLVFLFSFSCLFGVCSVSNAFDFPCINIFSILSSSWSHWKERKGTFHHSGCSQVNQFISWISAQVMQTNYFFEFLVRVILEKIVQKVFYYPENLEYGKSTRVY